ncbi:MAG: hypothetical protein H6739_07875 [Alphaproteobacteria bacterium]|nr:hypothetical protein [Alphaproteobacteria bacterium]
MNIPARALFLAALTLAVACGDKEDDTASTDDSSADDTSATDDTSEAQDIAIAGSYTDTWDTAHTITNTSWDQGYALFAISQYDNDAMHAIAQNDASNEYFPGLWSRFDWAWDGTDLYYCQTAYEAETEQDALDTARADAGDLAAGCGGFGWTQLIAD